jgi:hypothetical protein
MKFQATQRTWVSYLRPSLDPGGASSMLRGRIVEAAVVQLFRWSHAGLPFLNLRYRCRYACLLALACEFSLGDCW